jgi:hypothetical protein
MKRRLSGEEIVILEAKWLPLLVSLLVASRVGGDSTAKMAAKLCRAATSDTRWSKESAIQTIFAQTNNLHFKFLSLVFSTLTQA